MPQIAGLRGVVAGADARDPGRALYRYHQTFPDPAGGRSLTRKQIVCAVRLAPWSENIIRRHEATLASARDAALAELRTTRKQTAPVLAGYRDAATEADRLFRKAEGEPPTATVTTPDGCVHKLWRVASAEVLGALRHLFAPKKLHVLDGASRYEALLAYAAELDARQPLAMYSAANYALMCLVNLDDPALFVAPRQRAIRTAKPSAEVIAEARKYFIVEPLAGAANDPAKLAAALADSLAHQPAFVATWAGEPDAWKLTLSPDVTLATAGIDVHRAVGKLDPVVVEKLFVERLLAGTPLTEPAAKPDVVVRLRAVPLEQLVHVADVGQTLPAGWSAFHPPIAPPVSALIDPDEDLQ